MLKGVSRNVLVVRGDKGSRFESVYFVMKKGKSFERSDILKEANGIISKSAMTKDGGKANRYALLGFLAGIACGGVLTALVWIACFLLE